MVMNKLFNVHIPNNIEGELINILYSGQLTSGKNVRLFEDEVKNYINAPYFLAVNSYNSASSIVWELIGLKFGDEVIASPMSCLASNQPIAMKGGTLVWTDIDPYRGSLDPDKVRKNITSKTKAILHYHWGGYLGHIDEIIKIGNEYGIPVVQDGIESFGSDYQGSKFGAQNADFTLFSFQPVRLPTTIDGGGIVFKRKEDNDKAMLLRDYGVDRSKFRDELGEISEKCDISIPAMGAALNEINAFIGYKSMAEISKLIELQRVNALKNLEYINNLNKDIEHIDKTNTIPNYWIFSFLAKKRQEVLNYLRNEGILASKVHLRNDFYTVFGQFNKELKGVEKFNNEILSIPCGWWLN
jgi:dTDP-4-amino-4,6-dideoxygalactose transaminase